MHETKTSWEASNNTQNTTRSISYKLHPKIPLIGRILHGFFNTFFPMRDTFVPKKNLFGKNISFNIQLTKDVYNINGIEGKKKCLFSPTPFLKIYHLHIVETFGPIDNHLVIPNLFYEINPKWRSHLGKTLQGNKLIFCIISISTIQFWSIEMIFVESKNHIN